MRCKQCGWENPAGIEKCEKCHSRLEEYQAGASNNAGTDVLNGTVRESVVFPQNPTPQGVGDHQKRCPKCGYPATESSSSCPNCGHTFEGSGSTPTMPAEPPRIKRAGGTVMGGPVAGPQSNFHFCSLRPVAWPGEEVNYNPTTYSGEEIVLNRANTDPNNNSITSHEQAVLTFEDGDWYIENRSELRSTFIRVNGKVKLNSGDIIVLGNREFIFKG